jgi:hypothetical protein
MGARLKTALLMLPTVGLFVVLVLVAIRSRAAEISSEEVASRGRRIDLVERMRVALSSASDAERSAVLATTDEASRDYAERARAGLAQVGSLQGEFAALVGAPSHARARGQLESFTKAFDGFRKLDGEILDLAVQNSNLKAYALAFGPAAQAIAEMDGALSRIAARREVPAEARLGAARVLIAALRMQALLAPHIAEASASKMDALEVLMDNENGRVLQDLEAISSVARLRGDEDLLAARTSFARHQEVRARILKLSRENTNVRSLELTLDQNRNGLMSACQEALASLRQSVLEEQQAVVVPARPR